MVLNKLAQKIDRFSKEDQPSCSTGWPSSTFATRIFRRLAARPLRRVIARILRRPAACGQNWRNNSPTIWSYDLTCSNSRFGWTTRKRSRSRLRRIEKIEGSEGMMGKYYQVQYLVLQAQRASEKSQQEAKQAKDAKSEVRSALPSEGAKRVKKRPGPAIRG